MIETAAPPYVVTPMVLIVSDDPRASQLVAEAAVLAGGRIEATLAWAEVVTTLDQHRAIDVIAVEAAAIPNDLLLAALPVLDGIASTCKTRIVVALDREQIDLVAAAIFGPHVQLLCGPSIAERVVALTIAARTKAGEWTSETNRDGEESRLKRLNEEVARIAETLARLTRGESAAADDRPSPSVADRTTGYGAPPPEAVADIRPQDIRNAIRARRMRGQFFDDGLFEDPAWDMLLDLYAADLERAQVSVSSLCIAAAVAPTTALRWIAKMTESGLFERRPDEFDRRRAFMALSDGARDGMRGYCLAVKRAGLVIA